jgi:YidC/Oxa1 family membrane protein insertase
MNKNNIFIVVGIIGFIIFYQMFVLSPYQTRHREAQVAAQREAERFAPPTTPPAQAAETRALVGDEQTPLTATAQEPFEGVVPPTERARVFELQAGPNRWIDVLEGAALGQAVLADFFERDPQDKARIVLNRERLEWTSNNRAIQHCLNSLNQNAIRDGAQGELLMRAVTPSGACEFSLMPSGQHAGLLAMRLSLEGFEATQNDVVELRSRGTLGSDHEPDQNYLSYKVDDSTNNIRGNSLFTHTSVRGRMSWLTWGDRYFSIIYRPTGAYNPDLSYGAAAVAHNTVASETPIAFSMRYPARPESGKTRFDFSGDYYFGTRDTSALNLIDPELVETVDLGFFASVARVMLWSLKALNTFFYNFGVSIIALTLIVRIIFWPLNKKAYMSMIKMKELQPEMERIKKKYDTTDRSQAEKMNREIFALYKNKKVNPLGGCLPMLLQLPIFIGLYGALNHSVDLYQAPFFGWIQDLSMADPYYILPIVWTLSLLGYLMINPQAMSTNQPGMPNMKWIMIGMNFFFGFLSKDWPAGLVLYLVVSNCVGLSQQFFLQRSSKKLQMVKEGA